MLPLLLAASVIALPPLPSPVVDVYEQLVRFAVRVAPPKTCTNLGSTAARCLFLHGEQDPPPELLQRLTDLAPPILSLSECRKQGIIGRVLVATDPYIELSTDVTFADSDHAKGSVHASGGNGTVLVCRDQNGWHGSGWGGWITLQAYPGECQFASPPQGSHDSTCIPPHDAPKRKR